MKPHPATPPSPLGPRPPLRGARVPRRAFCLGALGAGALLLAGCARPADAAAPPEIHFGVDVCARCGMSVDDPAFAAGHRTTGGQARVFDDVMCMVRYQREQPEAVAASFVHDYNKRTWLKAETAAYVDSPKVRSPMGNTVAAVATADDARALVDRLGGTTLTYQEILARPTPPAKMPMQKGHGG